MSIRSTLPLLVLGACASNPAPVASPAPVTASEQVAAARSPEVKGPPIARKDDVVEAIAGQQVADPYRWMEGDENPEFDTWLKAQGVYAADQLAGLPRRQAILARVRELGIDVTEVASLERAGARLVYLVTPPGAQVARLDVRDADGTSRVLLDPGSEQQEGAHAAIHSVSVSPDASLVAVGVSGGGSEITTVRFLPVAGGAALPDLVENIWGEFAIEWLPDGKSFFYTQMADAKKGVDGMLGMRVKHHVVGQPVSEDRLVLGPDSSAAMPIDAKEFPIVSVASGAPRWMLAFGVGARSEVRVAVAPLASLDLAGGKTPWKQVASYDDKVVTAAAFGDRLYLLSRAGAPNGRVLSLPLASPVLGKARVEIPESEAVIDSISVARDGLYTSEQIGGAGRVRRLPWKGKLAEVPLPFPGSVWGVITDGRVDGALLRLTGWAEPAAYHRYDVKSGKLSPIGLGTVLGKPAAPVVAEELEAKSADGTLVPLSLVYAKDAAQQGPRPALMTGYGGYGISLTPSFGAVRAAWFEQGGVYAVCHVRGGGEKGGAWHEGGKGKNKLNGIADFIACGETLIARGVTSKDKLAVAGGSMGGVLVGRALVARPDLFAAAHIAVGMTNPLRILQSPNGANQLAELGSPETPEGAAALLAMDPYANVKDGTAYPPVIFTVGLRDHRVVPWMSGKLAARLQAASSSGKPILVRTDGDSGHGVGSTRDQKFAETADVWAFLLAQMK